MRASTLLVPWALMLDAINEDPTGTEPDDNRRSGEMPETLEKWRESRTSKRRVALRWGPG